MKKTANKIHSHLSKILTTTGHRRGFRNGIYQLKQTQDFYEKCKTVDEVAKTAPQLLKHIIGSAITKDLSTLGSGTVCFPSKTVISEIDWFCLATRKYISEINLFLTYKNEFESFFLSGQYQDALDTLLKIENHIGLSVWGLTSKMLVFEYTGKSEQAKILQSEILSKSKDGMFTSSLVNFLSQRCERKLSAHRYDRDVKEILNNLKSNLDDSNKDFYFFYLNFFEVTSFKNVKNVLEFDAYNSIIDRYCTFRRAVIYCLANELENAEILKRLPFIRRRIKDDLFNSVAFFNEDKILEDSFFDVTRLKIFDLFYSGLYDQVCENIKEYVSLGPIDFSLLNLYSRSLILNKSRYTALTDSPSLLNEISENIFRTYKREKNPTETLYTLYQISKNVDSFDISFQLASFIKSEQSLPHNKKYGILATKTVDPILFGLSELGEQRAIDMSQRVFSKLYTSPAIQYILKTTFGRDIDVVGIDASKMEIDLAKRLYNQNDLTSSLLIWKTVFENNQTIPPILETAVDYIFRIFAKEEKLDDAISWYVDQVIVNPFLVFKINTEEIHRKLKKERFKNVKRNIYLPIFISLISNDENEKSFTIEMFCKSEGFAFPSDLARSGKFEINSLAELFLFYTCSSETLNYYTRLNTTKKRLDERINICSFLAETFHNNAVKYKDELDLLTNELIIHEGTQKLDESKIYANDQAILNKELDEFEGLYNRYITIAGLFFKNISVLTLEKNDLRYLNKKGESDYTRSDVEYSKDARIDAYNKIFSLIREKFLFSKFGIVTYLSTRIRHGVLLGELRPELEKNNLIFFKNKLRNFYEPNSFWLNHRSLTQNEKDSLTKIITHFSSEVDELIDSIIKENIQIRTEGENENGWFDYDFSVDLLRQDSFTLYYETTYKAFCKKVLELLWLRTDANLEFIRETLQNDIKGRFVKILNNFDSDLRRLLGKDKMPELFTTLTACSTSLQNKIDKIASWFKRSGKSHEDFKVETLIDIICKHVQRAHPQAVLQAQKIYQFNRVLKGEYYSHFSDLIRIFIENIFKHSTTLEIRSTITTKEVNGDLIMTFENENKNPESELLIEESQHGATFDLVKLVTEGKSGIAKARKTVKDDLKWDANDILISNSNYQFKVSAVINFETLIA